MTVGGRRPRLLHFYGVPDVKELNHMLTRRRNPAGEADKVTAILPPSSFFQT